MMWLDNIFMDNEWIISNGILYWINQNIDVLAQSSFS